MRNILIKINKMDIEIKKTVKAGNSSAETHFIFVFTSHTPDDKL